MPSRAPTGHLIPSTEQIMSGKDANGRKPKK